MELSFEGIHVTLGKTEILKGVDLLAQDGKITGIIGPNGSGKSTLMKTLFGIVKCQKGQILLDGKPIKDYPRDYIAQHIGYIAQETSCPFDFTVREMVAMGLYPHDRRYRSTSKDEIITEALEQTGITGMGERSFLSLSGGEKKSVMLARAIAQQAQTLVLDEPTNHLDIRHQLFILDFISQKKFTSLIVLHDLNFACMYCEQLYLLNEGEVVAHGTPVEVLTADNVQKVFGVNGYAKVYDGDQCRFFLENVNL